MLRILTKLYEKDCFRHKNCALTWLVYEYLKVYIQVKGTCVGS